MKVTVKKLWFIYRYLLLLPYHSLCTQYNESYLPKKKALWRSLHVYYHWLRNKSNNFPPELSILKGFDYIKLKSPGDSILIQLCLIFFVAVCMRLWSRHLTTECFFLFVFFLNFTQKTSAAFDQLLLKKQGYWTDKLLREECSTIASWKICMLGFAKSFNNLTVWRRKHA